MQITKHVSLQNEFGDFIKKYHYLHSLPRGCKHVYTLHIDGKLIGVCAFGVPVGTNTKRKYSSDKPLLELKRFCLNEAPVNTGSWFLSRCLKLLQNELNCNIITYADPEQGHTGALYKATNFKSLGTQKYNSYQFKYKTKVYHLRNVYSDTKIGATLRAARKLGKLKAIKKQKKLIFWYGVK